MVFPFCQIRSHGTRGHFDGSCSGQTDSESAYEHEKGQVSFHHCLTFHGSPSNTSNQPRIAIAFHLQDRDNQYRIHRQKNGNVHVHNNDLVCRKLADGRPDYTDPVFCPVLWEGNLRQGEK